MENEKVLKIILIILGLPLSVLSLWRLLDPIGFFEFSGLLLSADTGLLSEARVTGGIIFGFSILILLGAFNKKLTHTSIIAAIIVYLGAGISRLIGMVVDGNPGGMVFQGMVSEFVFGLLAVFALIKYRDSLKEVR